LPETLYAIGENGHLWHVSLVCPCWCGATIALNLLPDDSPRWRLYESADGRRCLLRSGEPRAAAVTSPFAGATSFGATVDDSTTWARASTARRTETHELEPWGPAAQNALMAVSRETSTTRSGPSR
jgi:hypothetical protein